MEYLPKPDNQYPVTPDIYVIGTDGRNQQRLTNNHQSEFSLNWTYDNRVAYSLWQKDWTNVAWLYSVSPQGGSPERLYPFTAIDQISCSPDLLGANTATVKVTVSNTGKQTAEFPLEVSADRLPLDVVTARSQHRVIREDISLQSGESQSLEWSIPVPADQRVYLASTIESGSEFPISAAFCQVTPRTLGLPRLRWLGLTLGLVTAGFLLSIPWLRHQKNIWFWRTWWIYVILLIALVAIESAALIGAFG